VQRLIERWVKGMLVLLVAVHVLWLVWADWLC